MEVISPTRRASPLATTGFGCSGKRDSHFDVSCNILLLLMEMSNDQSICAKMPYCLDGAKHFCCVYVENFQPSYARCPVVSSESWM